MTAANQAGWILPVSFFALALVVLASLAAAPFVQLNRLDQKIERDQTSLTSLRKQIVQQSRLKQENKGLVAQAQETQLLLEGKTTGIAGANLQKMINDLVLDSRGTASSFQILPPKGDGNLTRIAMSLSISVGIDGLRDIVHRIETGTPLIFIDDIAVRMSQEGIQNADPYFLGPLNVTMQVSGYVLKDKAS